MGSDNEWRRQEVSFHKISLPHHKIIWLVGTFLFSSRPPFFTTSNCTIYEIYSPNNEWRRVLSHMLLGCHSKCDICWVVPIHTLCGLCGSGRMMLCYKPWKWNKTHCFHTNITKHEKGICPICYGNNNLHKYMGGRGEIIMLIVITIVYVLIFFGRIEIKEVEKF